MSIQSVKSVVGDLIHMNLDQARAVTKLIAEYRVKDILELGFHFGVSTCYMADAIAQNGGGSIVTIDRPEAKALVPTAEELLEKLSLRHLVTIYYEPTSYVWRLMKMIEENPAPRFDLCYIDGAHDWFVDGLAFFLADKLLRPGGWMLFDDLDWIYADSPSMKDTPYVINMPEDEKNTAQVRKVYELLVKPHPSYHNFATRNGWAYAQKRETASLGQREIVTETVTEVERVHYGAGEFLSRVANKARGR